MFPIFPIIMGKAVGTESPRCTFVQNSIAKQLFFPSIGATVFIISVELLGQKYALVDSSATVVLI